MRGEVTWARIARDGLVLLGVIAAVVYWLYLTRTGGAPVDAHAFWAADPSEPLRRTDQLASDGYYYSPAFEFVVGWARALPFEVFVAIWRAILLVILVYLAGPFTLFVLFTVPVASEINAGNIQLMLALAIVVGFRWPATWAFVVLTKLTPGVGALWFAFRRQWRAFGIAVGATVAIAAVSLRPEPERLGRLHRAAHRLTGPGRLAVLPVVLDAAAVRPRVHRLGRLDRPPLAGRRRGDTRPARLLHHQHVDARRCAAVPA